MSATGTGLGKDLEGLAPRKSTGSVITWDPAPGAYVASSFLSTCKDAACLQDQPPKDRCGGYVLIEKKKTVRVHLVFLANGTCRARVTGSPHPFVK